MSVTDKIRSLLENKGLETEPEDIEKTQEITESEEFTYDKDPAPGEAATKAPNKRVGTRSLKRKSPRQRRLSQRSTPVVEAKQDVQTAIELLAFAWGLTGDHCASVLEENSKNITTALMKILSRNPALLEKLQDSGILWDSIALLTALTPVAKSVWKHHVKKEEIDSDDSDLDEFPAYLPTTGLVGVGGSRIPGVMG